MTNEPMTSYRVASMMREKLKKRKLSTTTFYAIWKENGEWTIGTTQNEGVFAGAYVWVASNPMVNPDNNIINEEAKNLVERIAARAYATFQGV